MEILPVIGEVDFNKVKPLDTVFIPFADGYIRAIIKTVTKKGVIFTTPEWSKSENIFKSFYALEICSRIGNIDPFWGKPYSKLRWWLKM